jgi:hypothetical protein
LLLAHLLWLFWLGPVASIRLHRHITSDSHNWLCRHCPELGGGVWTKLCPMTVSEGCQFEADAGDLK